MEAGNEGLVVCCYKDKESNQAVIKINPSFSKGLKIYSCLPKQAFPADENMPYSFFLFQNESDANGIFF